MPTNTCSTTLSPEELLDIVNLQTEIAKLGLDLGKIMDLATNKLQELTGAAGAIIELAEEDDMVYRTATGIARHQLGLRLPRADSLSGMCIEKKEILTCDDSENDARVNREACRKVGLRSMVVAPLFHNQSVVGVLKIASNLPNFFNTKHVCVLNLMSELIAASMYYSAKYEIKELYYRATHDALTGIANRALFYDRLRQSLAQARRKASVVGVINLDMDGLKQINDTLGHRAGDAAIQEMAKRTLACARESDTVARLGGDEFGVILPDLDSSEKLRLAATRIHNSVCQPFHFEDKPLRLEASLGMASFPDDASELEELVEKADHAMYEIKKAKKSGS